MLFRSEGREQGLFQGLSARFEKGRIIGIVGGSGTGKSTLMKIIMRWYDPKGGQVLLSGQDHQTVSPSSLRLTITLFSLGTPCVIEKIFVIYCIISFV